MGDVTTTIPKDGDDFVTMENEEGETIGMSLPEEVEAEDGVAAESGTVVYQTDENVDVCVQSITDVQDGFTIDGVRELVTIKDKDAPKEYSFNFDLPEGYALVTSEEYCERKNEALAEGEEKMEVEPGFVYVVDGEDEIQAVLDAPWAKDANGNDVKTSYTIDGLTLTQHVEFDENSAFPIVADPTTHPTIHKTITLIVKKSEHKKLWKLLEKVIRKAEATDKGLFGTLLEAGSYFHFGIGVLSAFYNGAVGKNKSFLIKKQTVYTKAYGELVEGKSSAVGIYEVLKGTWRGGRWSCYYWKSESITWKKL